MLQMMERGAHTINTGEGQGVFVVNDQVFPTEATQHRQPPAPPLPGIEIVIAEFPEPNETTPWEDILDFRADPESRDRLRAFRRWLRKIGREGLTGRDAAEELRVLLADYDLSLRIHDMKTNVGLLRGLVVGTAEIVENLLKVKLAELAKLPFAAEYRKVERLAAELSAPGRDVAYVAKARDRFGRR